MLQRTLSPLSVRTLSNDLVEAAGLASPAEGLSAPNEGSQEEEFLQEVFSQVCGR